MLKPTNLMAEGLPIGSKSLKKIWVVGWGRGLCKIFVEELDGWVETRFI